jgi:PAS domain S-box-containing protein
MRSKSKNSTSEDSFTALSDLIADPVVIIDRTGKLLAANRSVKEATGFDHAEFVGKGFLELDFLDQESKTIAAKNLEKRMKGFDVEPYEIKLTSKNGEIKYFETRGKKIKYDGKSVNLVVFHDITQRKHSQELLKTELENKCKDLMEREEKLRSIFDSSPDAIAVCNLNGSIVDCNPAALDMFGYSTKEEVIGKGPLESVAKNDHQRVMKNLKRTLAQGSMKNVAYTFLGKDGREFFGELSASLIKDASGNAAGFVAMIKDVTERKNAEAALRESEEKHRKLFEESMDAIFVADAKTGIIVDCNPAASELVGREKSELVDQHQSIIHPREQMEGGFTRGFKQHLREQASVLETQIITKTGEIKDVAIKASLLQLKGKRLMQGTFRDITGRKLMEQALRDSKEKFHGIANSVRDTIILVDDEARVIYWNPAAEKTFGYSAEEATGKDVHELVVPQKMCEEAKENIKNGVRQFAETGSGILTTENVELIGRRKDGSEFPVKLSLAPIRLQGKWNAVGVAKDITLRKQNEKRLQEAEKRYHALFDQAPLGILVIDPATAGIVEFNEVTHRQLGYSREEFATLHISDFEDTEKPDETRGRIDRIMREGWDEFETKHRTKDGKIRNVVVAVQAIELSDKKLLLCIFHDVTEEKRMQDALREEHYKLEAIANSIGAGFVVISKDYRILWANKFIREYKGDVDGKFCYATLNSLDAPCPDCGVKKVFEQGALSDSHEYTSIDIRGNPYWVELIATPIKDADGKVETAIEVCIDITEKKNMQSKLADYSRNLEKIIEERTEQLRQTQDKLIKSERLAAIGELASMVGHDLRNPLTSIKNATYYLKKKQSSGSDYHIKKMLEVIDSAIAHADKIIYDLLDYSREIQLEPVNCSPRSLLKEALSMVHVPERVKIIDATKEGHVIKADKAKIVRVFVNLVKNAVEAMPEGGTLQVKSTQADGNVEISFVDTGKGISKETMAKLFSPLVTTKAQGMGFGLAICKRVVEAHQGRITVQSVEDKGSTFTITIPIKPELKNGGEETWVNMPESLLSTTTKT